MGLVIQRFSGAFSPENSGHICRLGQKYEDINRRVQKKGKKDLLCITTKAGHVLK
jgi:hypothetical protein